MGRFFSVLPAYSIGLRQNEMEGTLGCRPSPLGDFIPKPHLRFAHAASLKLKIFLLLMVLLTGMPAQMPKSCVQPVFFSMLFPQLLPDFLQEATAGEAVFL